jgi:hypothetical protein
VLTSSTEESPTLEYFPDDAGDVPPLGQVDLRAAYHVCAMDVDPADETSRFGFLVRSFRQLFV